MNEPTKKIETRIPWSYWQRILDIVQSRKGQKVKTRPATIQAVLAEAIEKGLPKVKV